MEQLDISRITVVTKMPGPQGGRANTADVTTDGKPRQCGECGSSREAVEGNASSKTTTKH